MSGPLKVGNSLVDAFTLQYYEGFPKDQVAWGEIASDKQWRVLSKLKNGYQDSLFTSVAVAQNVAKPLVKYIDNALVGEGASKAKSRCWWDTTRISLRCSPPWTLSLSTARPV